MPKKSPEYMYIKTTYCGYLAPLHMMGPIMHPIQVMKSQVIKLMMAGATVWEYDIETHRTLELNFTNIKDPDRFAHAFEEEDTSPKSVEATVKVSTGVKLDTPNQEPEEKDPKEEAPKAEVKHIVEVIPETPKVDEIKFELNEDGTVNEANIDWYSYKTKEERRALREKINKINSEAKASKEE